MVEYLHNAIRATAGEDAEIIVLVNEDNEPVTQGVNFMLHMPDDTMRVFPGEYKNEMWLFTVPAEATKGLEGKLWYCLCDDNAESLCFKAPFILI